MVDGGWWMVIGDRWSVIGDQWVVGGHPLSAKRKWPDSQS
jgi:hypothetical protein